MFVTCPREAVQNMPLSENRFKAISDHLIHMFKRCPLEAGVQDDPAFITRNLWLDFMTATCRPVINQRLPLKTGFVFLYFKRCLFYCLSITGDRLAINSCLAEQVHLYLFGDNTDLTWDGPNGGGHLKLPAVKREPFASSFLI